MQASLLSNPSSSVATGAAGSASPASSADAGLELFTKLLVAQVKNQDPLAPTDPSQFVNQLTQQTQMEALQKLAAQGGANAATLQSLQALALGAQVGSRVTVATDHVRLDGPSVPVTFTLGSAAAQTDLVLTGADGVEHHVPLGSHRAGDVSTTLEPAALGLPAGTYALRVDTDTKEQPVVQVTGTISNVRLSPSGSVLVGVAGVGDLDPSYITQFNGQAGKEQS